MIITDSEKLILLMLSDLHEVAGLDKVNTKFLRSAISTNNTWAINWEMPDLGMDLSDTPVEAIDIVNYMHMWGVIEDAWHSIPESRKESMIEKIQLGKFLKFPGFHSHQEEKYYRIAKLFVDDMGRFERYKGRDLNSHVPMLEQYKKMYSIYDRIVGPENYFPVLTPENLDEIFSSEAI